MDLKMRLTHETYISVLSGVEFIVTTQAFYCKLCKEFAGDASCAEHHLQSEHHYKKYIVSAVIKFASQFNIGLY